MAAGAPGIAMLLARAGMLCICMQPRCSVAKPPNRVQVVHVVHGSPHPLLPHCIPLRLQKWKFEDAKKYLQDDLLKDLYPSFAFLAMGLISLFIFITWRIVRACCVCCCCAASCASKRDQVTPRACCCCQCPAPVCCC
jgi:hypothetical protein